MMAQLAFTKEVDVLCHPVCEKSSSNSASVLSVPPVVSSIYVYLSKKIRNYFGK